MAYSKLTVALAFIVFAWTCAAAYPERPVRLIVPVGPGGAVDVVGRITGQKLSVLLGQNVVIDNRGGANYIIGTEIAARSLQELIDMARASPGRIIYCSGGFGNLTHIAGELFQVMTGVKLNHVPYKSAGPAINDLVAGHVPLMFGPSPVVVPMVQAGRLRPLAFTGLKRSAQLPAVLTVDELGIKGYEATGWYGIYAPRGTPRAVVDTLNAAVLQMVQMPDTRERFAALNLEPVGSSPEALAQFLKEDLQKYARIAKMAGIQLQ